MFLYRNSFVLRLVYSMTAELTQGNNITMWNSEHKQKRVRERKILLVLLKLHYLKTPLILLPKSQN